MNQKQMCLGIIRTQKGVEQFESEVNRKISSIGKRGSGPINQTLISVCDQ